MASLVQAVNRQEVSFSLWLLHEEKTGVKAQWPSLVGCVTMSYVSRLTVEFPWALALRTDGTVELGYSGDKERLKHVV